MRITIELEVSDALSMQSALRTRARQLHNRADETLRDQPDCATWAYYRQRANELQALADRLYATDTDVSELISSSPLPE
jgi:hypothetical protein